ncbi:hypothetical protein N3K66_004501 [Trichothecium roseum]|uniref:Uncharacterized protein n=1 Tax=Trichothecium roseum TaxID=47278 RepID=A0ACC0V1G7_9HYPO|nr:hypothetical protein N3K66_004501 [Trichothecium roseum]
MLFCKRLARTATSFPRVATRHQVRHLTLQSSQAASLFLKHGIPIISAPTTIHQDDAGAAAAATTTTTTHWHLAMTIDRENRIPTILLAPSLSSPSSNGQTTLASMIRHQPTAVSSHPFRLTKGITPTLVSQISQTLNLGTEPVNDLLQNIFAIFASREATHLELSPLSISSSTDGNGAPVVTYAAAVKEATFDDAAASRQPDLFALRSTSHEDPAEVEAEKHGLVYVRMEQGGNVGNVVNGAGLAMATNDAVALHGGRSANFLDAGGQATKRTMIKAFDIVLRDERVTAVLVNIYGGITNGVMIAESIIGAAEELGPLKVPVVVRLQGTNSAEGLKLLEKADLGLVVEADFGEAARKAVELAGPYKPA